MTTVHAPAQAATAPEPARPRPVRAVLMALGASAATTVLALLGTGLHPHPAASWLLAVPSLLLATRLRSNRAGIAAALGYALGSAGMWHYAVTALALPAPALAAYIGVPAVGFGLMTAVFGVLVARGRLVAAMFWVPAAWVSLEYLTATATTAGTFLSLATSQVTLTPLRGLTSLTGGWGITFVLLLTQAAVAVVLRNRPGDGPRPGRPAPRDWLVAGLAAALLAAALGYGQAAARRAASTPAPSVRIAMISLAQPAPTPDPGSRNLLSRYVIAVHAAAAAGARIVVLPENILELDDATRAAIEQSLVGAVRPYGASVVAGFRDRHGTALRNVAVLLGPDGSSTTVVKQHLIPGVEAEFEPGDGEPVLAEVAGVSARLLVCKDLDFPALVRRHGAVRPGMLLVPAWDFDADGWLHSRITALRAAENGVAVVRTARDGRLTLIDPSGAVTAERRQPGRLDGSATGDTILTADVRPGTGRTPYAAAGDWLAYLCLAMTAGMAVLLAFRGRRPTRRSHR